MDTANSPVAPRLLRPVPPRLGLYIRVGRNGQQALLDLIARRDANLSGVVIDANSAKTQRELRERTTAARLDVVLDPRTQPSATPGGHGTQLAGLPWGLDRPHAMSDFAGANGRKIVAAIATFAVEHQFSQVIAPTHLFSSADDRWFALDIENCAYLRQELDRVGGRHVPIIYSLALPYAVFRDSDARERLIDELRDLQLGSVWLRVDGLGSGMTSSALRFYHDGASDFAQLAVPIVADGMGGLVGLSLLAFGVAGGLAHGVTFGERFDASSWRKRGERQGGGQRPRVYIPALDLMLAPDEATQYLRQSNRARALFACHDTHCCPRGLSDMIENPARHFLIQRAGQVSALSGIHTPLRASEFLERVVRPASDRLMEATRLQTTDKELNDRVAKQRKRIDAVRVLLSNELKTRRNARESLIPAHRTAREGRSTPRLP